MVFLLKYLHIACIVFVVFIKNTRKSLIFYMIMFVISYALILMGCSGKIEW